MDGVMLFEDGNHVGLQMKVDEWVKKNKPTIKSTSITTKNTISEHGSSIDVLVLSVTYHINERG